MPRHFIDDHVATVREPEVADAGHDRAIINLREQHIEAWLNPQPGNLAALYAIFDDRQHRYYEHGEAA